MPLILDTDPEHYKDVLIARMDVRVRPGTAPEAVVQPPFYFLWFAYGTAVGSATFLEQETNLNVLNAHAIREQDPACASREDLSSLADYVERGKIGNEEAAEFLRKTQGELLEPAFLDRFRSGIRALYYPVQFVAPGACLRSVLRVRGARYAWGIRERSPGEFIEVARYLPPHD